MKYDIVYILREGVDSDELRYSLRSVCKNFEYNKIWFYCGCPKDIKPDEYVPFKQIGYNPLDKVHSTFEAILKNEEITENFYLFNDDFFIMQPYEQEVSLSSGSLDYRALLIEQRRGKESLYNQYVKYTSKILKERGYDSLSYEGHTPLLINKERGLQALRAFPDTTLFRSIYGNYNQIGGKIIDDVKVIEYDVIPDEDCILLSTDENSFAKGKVGEFIRERFSESCQYEIVKKLTVKDKIAQVVKKSEISNGSALIEETKFEKLKKSIYNKLKEIKRDYFTFPYEE